MNSSAPDANRRIGLSIAIYRLLLVALVVVIAIGCFLEWPQLGGVPPLASLATDLHLNHVGGFDPTLHVALWPTPVKVTSYYHTNLDDPRRATLFIEPTYRTNVLPQSLRVQVGVYSVGSCPWIGGQDFRRHPQPFEYNNLFRNGSCEYDRRLVSNSQYLYKLSIRWPSGSTWNSNASYSQILIPKIGIGQCFDACASVIPVFDPIPETHLFGGGCFYPCRLSAALYVGPQSQGNTLIASNVPVPYALLATGFRAYKWNGRRPADLTFEDLTSNQSDTRKAIIVGVLMAIGGAALISLLQTALIDDEVRRDLLEGNEDSAHHEPDDDIEPA